MKKYLSILRIKLMNNLQYRVAAIAGISTQIFFGLVFILIYLAFYQSGSNAGLPMNWKELVSYLWLNQVFFTLVFLWQKERDLINMIKDGNISYELCRPIDFYKKWYATMYGTRISAMMLRFIPVTIIALLLPEPYKLYLPISLEAFIVFIIAIIISSLLVTSIALIIHIVAMFTLDERGIMAFMMVIGDVFSGGTVPLAFFPKFLQRIAYILPFRHVVDVPFRIYSGNISISNAMPHLIFGIIWLIITVVFGYLLSLKAVRKAVIQGG